MKKRLLIILSSLFVVVIVGLAFVGNYFYDQGIKRGTEVELHREDEAVNVVATDESQMLIDEANDWYDEQETEIIEMTTYDDLNLVAQFIEGDSDEAKAVILAHGFRNTSDNMGKLAKFYYDKGFDILIPDARGHGESEGDYIGYGWHDRHDYVDWIDVLIEGYRAEDIILHGNSMGAATVLMTSGEELPEQVKGIIADSGYSSVKDELAHQLNHIYGLPAFPLLEVTSVVTNIRAGYTLGEASAIDQLKQNELPLFIIHGDDDDLVPTEMAYEIAEATAGNYEMWIVPGAGHTKAFDNVTEEFYERVSHFINTVLDE
ncbi:alpha/beta hydrolase [Alkalibacillus haloalkaliphilus]|uniref:alpha/beta hydrolase n=1 Tax=Alkalibacillus haloalkaliphilus TaxID=94136 RepID=UPI002935FA39|nr:alpha/beta hydrolase [Alkalibacillus haloalkaliphilus]MDV2581309.1 alpha/beta hydrolase [Alkalibacillus haloalkaliphilus]